VAKEVGEKKGRKKNLKEISHICESCTNNGRNEKEQS
jgi:hypothetical protein